MFSGLFAFVGRIMLSLIFIVSGAVEAFHRAGVDAEQRRRFHQKTERDISLTRIPRFDCSVGNRFFRRAFHRIFVIRQRFVRLVANY